MTSDIQDREREETWGSIMAYVRKHDSGITVHRVDSQWATEAAREPGHGRSVGGLFEMGEDKAPDLDRFVSLLEPWLAQKPGGMIFGICLRFSDIQDHEGAVSCLDHLHHHGLRLILWRRAGSRDPLPRALLWQASKMGIWNHISGKDLFSGTPAGAGAWIANNPNIVHSFDSAGSPPSEKTLMREGEAIPRTLLSYGGLPDLPGIPFWQVLGAPQAILAALGLVGAKELLRLRAHPDRQEAFRLGSGLEYHLIRPGEIDPQTMDQIVAMVDAGGSVDITHVRANLEKAYLIAYVTENGVIVGNSSLKHPRQVFIDRLNRITGLDFTRFVERGYTSVRPEYRAMGIGAKLLEGLTCRARDVKVFSLISEDNVATQKIALRNKTRKIAVYYSEKAGKEMGVWMPEHMIDSNWETDL